MSSIAETEGRAMTEPDYDPEGQWTDDYIRQLREEIEATEDYSDPDYLWSLDEDDVREMRMCACCCCARGKE